MAKSGVEGFLEAADEVASFFKSRLDDNPRARIITHTDPDGIASGSILAKFLRAYDVAFHISFSRPLGPDEISELAKEDYDLFIFLDQGSGQIHHIQEHLLDSDREVVILDHHPGDFSERPGLVHLNPHPHALNGSSDVSASGVVYSVVERIAERFDPLSGLAIIGALGDRQEFPSGFSGVNQRIVDRAIDDGVVDVKEGLKLVGRTLPVADCLSSSIRPYLLGLSGNKERCQELIDDLDFGADITLAELGSENGERLRDAIIERLEVKPIESLHHALWGVVYTSTIGQIAGPKDMHECVTMLDACGKFKKPEIGFGALLGDESSGDEALEILLEYQKEMIEALEWMSSNREEFKTTPHMRHIYTGDRVKPKMIGEALSIGIESGLIEPDRPVLGLADSDTDRLKVSARVAPSYAESGPNIGSVLREISRDLGGQGGGHDVAAAARLPREMMDEFIAEVDREFEKRTNKSMLEN